MGLLTAVKPPAKRVRYDSAQHAVDRITQEKFNDKKIHTELIFLDDYAYLLASLLTALQVNWRTSDLHLAIKIANILCERFMDQALGGFFFTPHHHEKLIQRTKPLLDNVMPSGNGMAAIGLYQLGYLLAETKYLAAAENTLKYAWPAMQAQPHLYPTLLSALREYFTPTPLVILVGNAKTIALWRKKLKSLQHKLLIFELPAETSHLPPALSEKKWPGFDVAYRCEGTRCYPRYDSLEKLLSDL